MGTTTEQQLRAALENAQHQLTQAKARTAAAEAALTRNDELHAAQLREKLGPAAQQLVEAQAAFERLKEESAARLREVEALWKDQVAQRDEALRRLSALTPIHTATCLRGGSARQVTDVQLRDADARLVGTLFGYVEGAPEAVFDKEVFVSEVKARACLDCGHGELVFVSPAALAEGQRRATTHR